MTVPLLLGWSYQDGSFKRGRYDDQGLASVPAHSAGRYSKTPPDYVDRFYSLLHCWQSETFYISSTPELIRHPAFQAIVQMGEPVIPLLLREIRQEPSMLTLALNLITGETPYSSDDRGNVKAMADAWISWAERKRAHAISESD